MLCFAVGIYYLQDYVIEIKYYVIDMIKQFVFQKKTFKYSLGSEIDQLIAILQGNFWLKTCLQILILFK